MNDMISRQDALDAIEERIKANGYVNVALISELNRLYGYIRQLPSAQPEKVCIAKITLSEEQVREAVEKAKSEIVQVFPSAQPEQRWVPVTLRCPTEEDYKPFAGYDDGVVLELLRNGEMTFGWYYESTQNWASMDDAYADVIAWKSLPEPWKGEANADNSQI